MGVPSPLGAHRRKGEGGQLLFSAHEGKWDEVMDVVKRATKAVGAYGTRMSLVLKADIRPGHTGEIDGKLERLEAALGD
ncbi:hypothetical protein NS263_14080 [Curtobacterium oceanosedimentum]|uniref:Thiamine-binding protein domain-containing protein n=1 Tax=Curtobacterium oceanosedimentum TaxID=465820 RepID=A0ABR5S3F6_9MICO|nr:hypothetical protein NS263_14080 [Curtobacterium oceanosedimentum]